MRRCFPPTTWSLFVFISGTAFLFVGMLVCASAIDKASQDVLWKPTRPDSLIIWPQERSDPDATDSYVITKRIRTEVVSSHRPRGMAPRVQFPPLIIFCIAAGYLMQAISLPLQHWPPQALQFLTTVFMFLCRSFLRRQDLPDRAKRIDTGCCTDWIAKRCLLDPQRLYEPALPGDDPDISWSLSSIKVSDDDAKIRGCRCAQDLLEIREFLARTTQDKGSHTQLASTLALAINEVTLSLADNMNVITSKGIDHWARELEIQVDGQATESLELMIEKHKEGWKADENQLGALISLLLSGINPRKVKVLKMSALTIGPSHENLEFVLRRKNLYDEIGLYQIPPQDSSTGFRVTVEKPSLLGNRDMTGEEDDDEVTFSVSRIGENAHLDKSSGAKLARISKVPVGQLYAQHMFVCFMWTIGKALSTKKDSVKRSDLANDTLFRRIDFTGLSDLNFARVAVMAPLSWYELLPD
ncbi:hypothetical protein BO94DRAFT_578395 [Aspergillus sclerotioniger CBS 115572]|uniref:Uncharacterized protein n=1 Tax=Aspergillus sclerotioniger CBS 115572 TaxID=1450535 RepID=A0A317VJJ1_9EURO|nr:hypothetical protein BO94DRAFT_578395 [Aspergillus sclerotioniger CBS 115572]PWY73198.1 hypothetical protein BO94DRAFT_578395 [Aspergillus sclerotioniger CBS 115572]